MYSACVLLVARPRDLWYEAHILCEQEKSFIKWGKSGSPAQGSVFTRDAGFRIRIYRRLLMLEVARFGQDSCCEYYFAQRNCLLEIWTQFGQFCFGVIIQLWARKRLRSRSTHYWPEWLCQSRQGATRDNRCMLCLSGDEARQEKCLRWRYAFTPGELPRSHHCK